MHNYILIIIICFFVSCSGDNQIKNYSEEVDIKPLINEQSKKISEYRLPIPTFDNFKNHCETSGVLNKNLLKKYYVPNKKGFLGYYSLFNKDEYDFIGDLIVFVPQTENWKISDSNQIFISVKINNKGLKIGKNLQIGNTKNQIIEELGQPKFYNDSLLVFYDDYRTFGMFNLKLGKVRNIKYGLLNTDGDSLTDIDIINLYNNW